MAMNFEQVLHRAKGLTFNKEKMRGLEEEVRAEWPYAEIIVNPPSVLARIKGHTCMKCGDKLRNVTKLKWDRKSQDWVERKSLSNLFHAAVCMSCDPKQTVGIQVGQSIQGV